MKRSEALKPLSHQHHNSLMACLLIRKGLARQADPAIVGDFARKLYLEDIIPHFEAEERFLFPLLSASHLNYLSILRTDHERLGLLGERFRQGAKSPALLETFSNLLEQHIRFEERVVFNTIENGLDDQKKLELEKSLQHIHAKKCSDYPIKFWE